MIYRPIIPLLLTSTLSISAVCAQEVMSIEAIQVEEHADTIEARRDNSIAKRFISGEELTKYGDLNALEILKRTPGVSIPDSKNTKSSPGKGYTVILIDGEEAPSGSKRANPLEQIAPDMIERIEIMTNGSAEYTAESMGGIVNIVLKQPKSKGHTIAKATVGEYGGKPMDSMFLQREGKSGDLGYLVNLSASDNREIYNSSTDKQTVASSSSEQRNNTMRNQSLNVTTKLRYTPSEKDKYFFDGSINFHKSQTDTDALSYTNGSSVPGGQLSNYDRSHGMMLWSVIKGEHHLSGSELLEWKLKFHQNDDNGDSGSTQMPSSSVRMQNDKGFLRILGAESIYSIAKGDHFIKTGVELKGMSQRDEVQRTLNGIDATNPTDNVSMHQNKGSVYVLDEVSFGDNTVVTPGVRYETLSRDYGATTHTDYMAPSLHFLTHLSANDNFRASIAKTVKLPRLDELSSSLDSSLERNDIRHPDTTGNPNLTEEKALSYELRLEHYFEDKGIMSLGGFYRNIDNKIEQMTVLEGSRYVMRPYNSGQGTLHGIELELKKSLSNYVEGVGMFANATFQNSSLTNNTTGTKRPFKQTSNTLANIGLDHTLKRYNLTYGTAYRYVGGYDDPLDETLISQSQKGYGALDLYASKRIDKTFKFQLNLKNITRTTIENTATVYNNSGVVTERQVDNERSKPYVLLTLEGRW
ncbi:TonB-dependent receptor plug domain-containing protein [Sulfuricurvum sp.]|uniref:TonB-dependent receptor plug domain-containing protein n=1 Tax=Sulfuricurvum sp. TaxID=2025608 RepID=UPI00356605E0